jgi:hypothetical protein
MNDMTRLGRDLDELERTDPAVAAAAAALDDAIGRQLLRTGPDAVPLTRFRKSTPTTPMEVLR